MYQEPQKIKRNYTISIKLRTAANDLLGPISFWDRESIPDLIAHPKNVIFPVITYQIMGWCRTIKKHGHFQTTWIFPLFTGRLDGIASKHGHLLSLT